MTGWRPVWWLSTDSGKAPNTLPGRGQKREGRKKNSQTSCLHSQPAYRRHPGYPSTPTKATLRATGGLLPTPPASHSSRADRLAAATTSGLASPTRSRRQPGHVANQIQAIAPHHLGPHHHQRSWERRSYIALQHRLETRPPPRFPHTLAHWSPPPRHAATHRHRPLRAVATTPAPRASSCPC